MRYTYADWVRDNKKTKAPEAVTEVEMPVEVVAEAEAAVEVVAEVEATPEIEIAKSEEPAPVKPPVKKYSQNSNYKKKQYKGNKG